MKIFFPVQLFFPSQAGGPANSIYWLTKNLIPLGFEPVIVATDEGIGPEVERGKWRENEGGRSKFVATRSYAVPVRQVIAALGEVPSADIIQTASLFHASAVSSALFGLLLKKKIIISPRGELAPYSLKRSRIRKRPVAWIYKLFLRHKVLFHATSVEEADDIRAFFGPGIRVVQIPNLIELEEPVDVPVEDIILYMGRLHPQKGTDTFIRALALSERFMAGTYTAVVAGQTDFPQYEETIRELTATLGLTERVRFAGRVENDEKTRLLARSRWTVLPSRAESFGVVVVESLAQGTPVIAAKGTPWKGLVAAGAGNWVDNSPEAIAQAIDEALSVSDEQYQRYRSNARSFVERDFDIRSGLDRWLEVYKNL